MSLASQVALLAARVAAECKSLRTSVNGKAPTVHTHDATQLVSGLIPNGRLYEGISGARKDTIKDMNVDCVVNGFYCLPPGSFNTPEGAGASAQWWLVWTTTHDPVAGNIWCTQWAQNMTAPAGGFTASDMWMRRVSGNTFNTWTKTNLTQNEMDARYITQDRSSGAGGDLIREVKGVLQFSQNTGGIAGSFVIETNMTFNDTMASIRVRGFNFDSGNDDVDITIGFYAYSSGPTFYLSGATVNGNAEVSQVRLMRRTSDSKVVIVIDFATTLSYPKFIVDVIAGYNGAASTTAFAGWTGSFQTSLAAFTPMTTPPLTTFVQGSDARLSDPRPPTAHTHTKAQITDLGTVGNVVRVVYTTVVPARPAGAAYVEWEGQVDPAANALAGDTWIPTA